MPFIFLISLLPRFLIVIVNSLPSKSPKEMESLPLPKYFNLILFNFIFSKFLFPLNTDILCSVTAFLSLLPAKLKFFNGVLSFFFLGENKHRNLSHYYQPYLSLLP